MKIDDLSIADLKAALDFAREELDLFRETAKKENTTVNDIPAFWEVSKVESKLYSRLLDVTRDLK